MDAYQELLRLKEQYPELTFNNYGYEKLDRAVMERNKDGVTAIEGILKSLIKGFVRFQNFKVSADGRTWLRYQVHYNDEGSFTGVAYTLITDFQENL